MHLVHIQYHIGPQVQQPRNQTSNNNHLQIHALYDCKPLKRKRIGRQQVDEVQATRIHTLLEV
jgi:hypothetical protein